MTACSHQNYSHQNYSHLKHDMRRSRSSGGHLCTSAVIGGLSCWNTTWAAGGHHEWMDTVMIDGNPSHLFTIQYSLTLDHLHPRLGGGDGELRGSLWITSTLDGAHLVDDLQIVNVSPRTAMVDQLPDNGGLGKPHFSTKVRVALRVLLRSPRCDSLSAMLPAPIVSLTQ